MENVDGRSGWGVKIPGESPQDLLGGNQSEFENLEEQGPCSYYDSELD